MRVTIDSAEWEAMLRERWEIRRLLEGLKREALTEVFRDGL